MANYAIVHEGIVIDMNIWDGISDRIPEIGDEILSNEEISIG